MAMEFTGLEVWQRGHSIVLDVYALTKKWPHDELFSVTNQIRRAVTSITANIAEGFERYYFKDRVRFYYQARGSAAEVQNFLLIARDLGYNVESAEKVFGDIAHMKRLLNGLIKSVRMQDQSSRESLVSDR